MRGLLAAIVMASSLAACPVVHAATVVTFDDLASASGDVYRAAYSAQGVRFSSGQNLFFLVGTSSGNNADRNGGGALGLFSGDTLYIDSPASSVFNIRSMDVADLGRSPQKTVFTYTYATLQDSGTRTVEAQDASGVSRIRLNLDSLVFFMLTVNSLNGIQIDNVEVGSAPIGPAVPEPGSWVMLLAGTGVVGAMLRRRNRRGAPA